MRNKRFINTSSSGRLMTWAEDAEVAKSPAQLYLELLKTMMGDLSSQGYAYASPADMILKHGVRFISQELTPEENAIVQSVVKNGRYKTRQCWYNAQQVASRNPYIEYVEGLMMLRDIPINHAWNTINGKVVDFTPHNKGKPVLGIIPDDLEYFGVKLPKDYVYRKWQQDGTAEEIIWHYKPSFVLKDPLPADEIIPKDEEAEPK